jgi:hypothetical protein
MRFILKKFTRFFSDKHNLNTCKYCKNRITILDTNKSYSYNDRCNKFILNDTNNKQIYYELAYNARKDENMCGQKGKFFEDRYFSLKR